MTRSEIVQELAERRVVEHLVLRIAHAVRLTPDLKDLCQMVYLILLEYDEAMICDLYEDGDALTFFLARVITNQYHSSHSPFHREIRRFSSLCSELTNESDDED